MISNGGALESSMKSAVRLEPLGSFRMQLTRPRMPEVGSFCEKIRVGEVLMRSLSFGSHESKFELEIWMMLEGRSSWI